MLACSGSQPSSPLRIDRSSEGEQVRLTLVPSPGIRVNALLKPVLELPDGTVLRFDSPRLTPDSAYFAEPPWALHAGGRVEGTLRASICGETEPACRPFVLEL
jgi:hypothetical protein